jgi:hypothetical protein
MKISPGSSTPHNSPSGRKILTMPPSMALSCLVAEAYPDLLRVAPQKLASLSDLWLLAHPDLVELPAVRAVIGFVTACAREDRVRLRG